MPRLAAQVGQSGTVTVRVVDRENELPVYQAEVQIAVFARGAFVHREFTGGDGVVVFDSIQRGNYVLLVKAQGYETERQPIDVSPGMQLRSVRLGRKAEVEYTPPPGLPVSATSYTVPKDARKEFERGKDRLQKGKLKDSIKHFRNAVKKYPDYVEAYTLLGLSLLRWREQVHRRPLSLPSTAQAFPSELNTPTQPGLPGSSSELGAGGNAEVDRRQSLAQRQEQLSKLLEEAVSSLHKAVELDPKLAQAHSLLGQVRVEEKNYAKAEEHLLKSLELGPDDAQIHYYLGRCYYERGIAARDPGLLDKALEHGLRAQNLPDTPSATHLLLANIYSLQRRPEAALRELEEFVREDPGSPVAPQVQKAIERLRSENP